MQTLLKLLQDGRFHSGEALGAAIGVSRSAVWKQLQQLQSDLGLEVHKVRGRGYRLASPMNLLDAQVIQAHRQRADWPITVHEAVDSTNAQALRDIAAGREAPFLNLSESQTAGRGRRGRTWNSPFGVNLYYSLTLRIEGGMRRIEGMSLVVGLAVAQALRDIGVTDVGLKWPNDVLVGNAKIAGILLELVGDPADVCHVVIGVGVNANMRSSADIDQRWSSIALQIGGVVDRSRLTAALDDRLAQLLERHAQDGFAGLRTQWESEHLWQGRDVRLIAGSDVIEGRVIGVDDTGALRLWRDQGEQVFSGGELSLRLRDDS